MNKEQAIELILERNSIGELYAEVGECFESRVAGETYIIVGSWSDLYRIHGLINGFEKLLDKPYLKQGETFEQHLEQLKAIEDPTYREKQEIEQTYQWIQFEKHLGDKDPITLRDLELEVVFSDEYSMCSECYSVVIRTSPDSYCWTAPLMIDGNPVCESCIEKNRDCYIEHILEEFCNVQKNIPDDFSTEELGLVKVNDESYENGLHGGQTDDPASIIECLNEHNIDVWFKVYPSQFYVSFDVYVKPEDKKKAIRILSNTDTTLEYDPKDNLEQALKSISSPARTEGAIPVTKVDISTGTATTTLVTEEDFIKGKH